MIVFETLNLSAPNGSIIGVIAEGSCVLSAAELQRIGPSDPIPSEPGNFLLEHPLATADAITRSRTLARFGALRRSGATLVLLTHDQGLLDICADEIWWLRENLLVVRGHPDEVLPLYRRYVAQTLRTLGSGESAVLSNAGRAGDGRATLDTIQLLDAQGQPTTVWQSGELATVRFTVSFTAAVADPVIGMLIRTRIGLNVYGTNTELEQLHPGPVSSGDILTVTFRFPCQLCPGDYTITAASHDPDGVWHDWREDAVAYAVVDSRYTAGVANLRAQVYAEVSRPADQSQSAST